MINWYIINSTFKWKFVPIIIRAKYEHSTYGQNRRLHPFTFYTWVIKCIYGTCNARLGWVSYPSTIDALFIFVSSWNGVIFYNHSHCFQVATINPQIFRKRHKKQVSKKNPPKKYKFVKHSYVGMYSVQFSSDLEHFFEAILFQDHRGR